MGFLRNILLALGVLALVETGLEPLWRLPALVPLLLVLPHGLAWFAVRAGRAGHLRRAALLQAVLPWSAPLVQLAAVLGFGWVAATTGLLAGGPRVDFAPGLDLLLALLPYLVAELATIDARGRASGLGPDLGRGMARLQTRLFLSAVLPIAAYVLLSNAVALHPTLHAWVDHVALASATFAGLLLALFALALPALLRSTWETEPLGPGWQRLVVEETARRAGFRCKEIRVWHTSNLMANAAVIGFLPQHRVVLLSDALLHQLGPSELAAVFAHEMGHAQRRHVWVFAAWALAFFLAADVLLTWLALESLGLELAIFAAVVGSWYLSFGYLSRRFELDADLASVSATGDPDGLIRALERVGGAHARERSSWRHFSVADRVRFLTANRFDPSVGQRLRRRLSRWSRAGVVAFLVAAGLELALLVESMPVDRVRVDLRLGRFAQARERASGLDLEPRLAASVEETAGWPEGAKPPALLEGARRALEGGRLGGALALLDLADLRGGVLPEGLRAVLGLAAEGDLAAARSLGQGLSPEWRAALGRALTGS